MKPRKENLSEEEKDILNAFESGQLGSIPKVESQKKRIQSIVKSNNLKKSSSQLTLVKRKGSI
jgi:hypothetical protein